MMKHRVDAACLKLLEISNSVSDGAPQPQDALPIGCGLACLRSGLLETIDENIRDPLGRSRQLLVTDAASN